MMNEGIGNLVLLAAALWLQHRGYCLWGYRRVGQSLTLNRKDRKHVNR